MSSRDQAVGTSSLPYVLRLTRASDNDTIGIPWHPAYSPPLVRLRLIRGEQYQATLSRVPLGSGFTTDGFWWADLDFAPVPDLPDLAIPPKLVNGMIKSFCNTVRVLRPDRAGDFWVAHGHSATPLCDVDAWKIEIDNLGRLCHSAPYAQLKLTEDSLVEGTIEWLGLPLGTNNIGNPLVIHPNTIPPGAYDVTARAVENRLVLDTAFLEFIHIDTATNVVWLSASQTNEYAIPLSGDTYPLTGIQVWSDPPGIDSLSFAPSALTSGVYTVYLTHGLCGAAQMTVYIANAGMTPDMNRNGAIDNADKALLADNGVFRFWINDDADAEGDFTGATGIPGQTPGNHADFVVNGRGDLIDFFPVWLDLHDVLSLLPPSEDVQYKLRQAGNALKAVYTDLAKDQAGGFLTVTNALYGPSLGMYAYVAPTFGIGASGVELAPNFLQRIADDPDKGILLIEGAARSDAPLALEIWKDGTRIGQAHLPLCISGVEEMYRRHNFRVGATILESLSDPTNRPDAGCLNVDVFLAHGFRVSENESRAWGSEFFKRLYREGMDARFHAVTWSSDTGSSVSYEDNVNNAFLTASNYAARVNAIKSTNQSQVVVMAHSLGCMLTSAAIADHGLATDKFLALNGAVPSEAFDAAMIDERTNALNRLLHPEWRGYAARTWSANWHRLFTNSVAFPNDDRAKLNWRGRFGDAAPVLYNFWSSGDEVLEIATTDINLGSGVQFDWGWTWPPVSVDARRYVWNKQALFKGRSWLYGTTWAGWGFWEWALPLVGKVYSMDEANALTDDQLRAEPVFRHNPDEMFTSNIVVDVQNNILARGIPELSYPIGYTNVTKLNTYGATVRNFDVNLPVFRRDDETWPQRSVSYGDGDNAWLRWLHTDLINLPHYYTHKLFKKLVEEGDMR